MAGVSALGNWVAVARRSTTAVYVCKPATLVFLVGLAAALHPEHGDVRAWFVVALVFSLAGDVFLMLPTDQFVAGLSAFLVAHIAYIVGLNQHGGSVATVAVAWAAVIAALGWYAAYLARAARRHGQGALVPPVLAYVAAISLMLASAIASGNAVAIVGATLFCFSDSLIAWNRFVRPVPWASVGIMVTYHLGQLGLVLSLLR